MAEGGRIEPGPAAPAAGPAPVPAELIREAGRQVRAEWAADLLTAYGCIRDDRLAGPGELSNHESALGAAETCQCAEHLWVRSVLALLRNLAGQ